MQKSTDVISYSRLRNSLILKLFSTLFFLRQTKHKKKKKVIKVFRKAIISRKQLKKGKMNIKKIKKKLW